MKEYNYSDLEKAGILLKILKDQKQLFGEVCTLENKKTNAIINRDGKELELISKSQEHLLSKLSKAEEKRIIFLAQLSSEKRIPTPDSISEVVNTLTVNKNKKESIQKESGELLETIIKMRKISETNRVMLEDNNTLFKNLIDEIRSEDNLGYSEHSTKGESKPLFVDANC